MSIDLSLKKSSCEEKKKKKENPQYNSEEFELKEMK